MGHLARHIRLGESAGAALCRAHGTLDSRWRAMRACNDNAYGESKSQNSMIISWILHFRSLLTALRCQFTDT